MGGSFSIFDIVIIVGIIQGIVAAIVISSYPSESAGKKILSAILVTLVLLNFKILLHTLGLWKFPVLHYLPLAIDTLIQPLIYLYICSLTQKEYRFNRKNLWHFLPVFLFQSHAVLVYIFTLFKPDILIKDVFAERYFFYNNFKWVEDLAAIISAVIYWILSLKKILAYRHWLFTSQSATQYSELTWLRNLLIVTGILAAALTISSIPANIFQLKNSFLYLQLFYCYLTMLIYYLSFQGYKTILTTEVHMVRFPEAIISEPAELIESVNTINKPSTNIQDFSDIKLALTEVMEKQMLFMEPELSLKELAGKINFPTAQVSAAINAEFGINFRSWVNSYRVEEVKKRLGNPKYEHLSLTGIAFDCGFNSEASFYRIFRQQTGYSPKSYLQLIHRKH